MGRKARWQEIIVYQGGRPRARHQAVLWRTGMKPSDLPSWFAGFAVKTHQGAQESFRFKGGNLFSVHWDEWDSAETPVADETYLIAAPDGGVWAHKPLAPLSYVPAAAVDGVFLSRSV